MKRILVFFLAVFIFTGTASADEKWLNSPVGMMFYGGGNVHSYGLAYNQTADSYARTGELTGEAVGGTLSDALLPIQAQMKRVVLSDAGEVQYYLCATDSTLKEDCATAAVLDGTDGQVMVEIPKFYFKYSWVDPVHTWEISSLPGGGFFLHPAFTKGGVEVDYRYFGAYEGWTDGETKLASVSGQLPTVSQNIATFRTRAEARGAGWHQQDFYLTSAVQMLYLIEYGDFDSQSMIGAGITDYETWPNGPQALGGNTNSIGNATGNSTLAVDKWNISTAYSLNDEAIPDVTQNGYTYRVTTAGTSAGSEPTWPTTLGNAVVDGGVTWTCVRHAGYMSYRGVENLYGHIWKFIDGFSVHNSSANGSRAWVAQDYTDYASDTETGYTLETSSLSQADGYVRTVVSVDAGFLPLSVLGSSSSTGLADYYYTQYDTNADSGWLVVLLGGVANYGTIAGAFDWSSSNVSSTTSAGVGGRICY